MPGTDQPRPISADELLTGLRRAQLRLMRALGDIGEGHGDAVDDVANIVRTLVGEASGGNKLIKRAVKQLKLTWPQIFAGPSPQIGHAVHLGIGNIPLPYKPSREGGARWMRVDKWAQQTALVLDYGNGQRKIPWLKLIEDYGNTYGSHVGTEISKSIDSTSRFYSNRLTMTEFLIYCAGWGLADAANQLIEEADGHQVVRAELKQGRLTPVLTRLTVPEQSMAGISYDIDDEDISEAVEVFKFAHLHTRQRMWERLTIEPNPDENIHSTVTLELLDKLPDWWTD